MNTCNRCINFKRTSRDGGLCFNQFAIALHATDQRDDRIAVADTYGCPEHQPKTIHISNDCIFRAAFRGQDGVRD